MSAPALPPQHLLALLRDPKGLGKLDVEGASLVSRSGSRRYPIIDSMPSFIGEAQLGPQNRKFQRMYDWMCHIYDAGQAVGDVVLGGRIAEARRRVAAALHLRPGHRLLYTSVGTGADLRYLGEQAPLGSLEFVGLDLSMGMLRRCRKRIRGLEATSLLVQANAEELPFADQAFDAVLHVGGINFFDRPEVAAREMLRVAKQGARIVVADETERVVTGSYQRYPLTRAYFKGAATDFNPRSWIPEGAVDPRYEEFWDGRMYILTFRAPTLRSP